MRFWATFLISTLLTFNNVTRAQIVNFTVGVENLQYYPLHTIRNGKFEGFAREVLDAFAAQHGYTFTYVPLPINGLFDAFIKNQTLDFKYPDNSKWHPELKLVTPIAYSTPIVVSEEGSLVTPEHRGRGLQQVKTLGTVLGFTPWPYMDEINHHAVKVVTNGSFEGLLRDGMANHIDAVYINVDVAKNLLDNVFKMPGGLVFDRSLPHGRSDFSVASIRHPDIIQEFNSFLQKEHSLIDRLRVKYGLNDQDSP